MTHERPILFSGPLVRALLAGKKTQTRRLMKPQPDPLPADQPRISPWDDSGFHWASTKARSMVSLQDAAALGPYGSKGDRLWVKENFTSGYGRGCWGTIFAADGAFVQGKRQHPKGPHYNADDRPPGMKWRPSIHLPRWASRITLEVTSVRVERLQSISEEDALAEGVVPQEWVLENQPYRSHRAAFGLLWDGINGKRASWASNPWVWVVSFRRLP